MLNYVHANTDVDKTIAFYHDHDVFGLLIARSCERQPAVLAGA